MNYSTGPEVSKLIKDKGIEIESEKYWVGNGYEPCVMWELGRLEDFGSHIKPGMEQVFPSYSLSELAEVFKVLGKKLGWDEVALELSYTRLCLKWLNTQSQERCDEFLINLIQN